MAINAEGTFSLDLSLFAGKVTDMAPGNLPAGVSPDCSDVWFGAQYVATRPALIHTLNAALDGGDIVSHLDYPQSTGETKCVILYDTGSLWTNSAQTGMSSELGQVAPGSQFKAVSAFNKFFMAFRGLQLTSAFIDAQLAGGDIPRYVNTLGNLRRVTTDAPGGGFAVNPVTISPENLVAPAAYTVGPAISSIAASDPIVTKFKGTTITVYTTYTVTLATSVSLSPGQLVQMYNITWQSGFTGPQWPGGVQVLSVTSGTVFKISAAYNTTAATANGGSFAYSTSATLVRNNNYVTAYLDSTSPGSPTDIQKGWYVTVSDTQPASVTQGQTASPNAVPSTGAVPFTQNELFQAIYPSSTGGGSPVTLLTGGVAQFYPHTHSFQGSFEYTFPGDGNNIPLPSPVEIYNLQNNQSIQWNTTSSILSGYPNSDTNQHPFTIAGVTPAGIWDGTQTTITYRGTVSSGELNDQNFCMVQTGNINVSAAGTYSFWFYHQEGTIFGVGNSATNPGGNPSVFDGAPQTKTALNGYPVMGGCNVSQDFGGYVNPMIIAVTFPSAGIYPFEIDWCKGDDADTGGAYLSLVMEYWDGAAAHPMPPTLGIGAAAVQGDGTGNVTVTLPMAVESLPIGAWLYLFLAPSSPASVVAWTQTGGGEGVIQVDNVDWQVGTEIQLNNFTATSGTTFNPANWNGAIVTISAVDGNQYAFTFSASTAGSGGAGSNGTATPTANAYPSGWVQVIQVPDNLHFVYFATNNTNTSAANGIVYDYFGSLNTQASLQAPIPGQATQSNSQSGVTQGFQVQSVNLTSTPNTITWFQQGFNDAYTGTHILEVSPNTQVVGGPRSMFTFFINEDGGASPGSYPINLNLNGGTQYPSVTLPIGPPGTVARGVAWTSAYGSDFFVMGSGTVPAAGGGAPVINTGTIVQDNTTTNTIMDFADVALTASILVSGANAVGSDFGDLTSTIVLPPCLGVLEYNQTLMWWGELNCLPNHAMINMGMQGGSATTSLSGSQPLGWSQGTVNSITSDGYGTLATSPDGFGWVYELVSGGGAHHQNCMIYQPAWQDYFGAPIFLPQRSYYMRLNGTVVTGTPTGNISFVIYSPSSGVLATATIQVAAFGQIMTWVGGAFSAAMPASIPVDTQYYLTLDGTASTNFTLAIRDLAIIDSQQPVLNNQLRFSYVDNEFGYDNQNGYVIGIDTNDFISSAFLLRQYLYVNTQNELHNVLSTGESPSQWDTSLMARECGSHGPDAVCTGQSMAWWLGTQGVFEFDGREPRKVSQSITQDFNVTNWDAAVTTCTGYDSTQRVMYFSFPINGSMLPNFVETMNFRMAELPTDEVHVSPYSGKIIATDMSRKWAPMSVPVNSIQNCVRQTPDGITRVMTFGGGRQGQSIPTSTGSNTGIGTVQTSVTLTPSQANNYAIFTANNGTSGNPTNPTGWTNQGFGMFTKLLSSADPLTVTAPSTGEGAPSNEWANNLLLFNTTGTPSVVQTRVLGTQTGIQFQTLPSPVTAGNAIIVVLQIDVPGTFSGLPTITDNLNNEYTFVGTYNNISSYLVATYVFVCLGAKPGYTTVGVNCPDEYAGQINEFSGLEGATGYGNLYMQDFINYPPINPAAISWNCVDADYGTIFSFYQTYFFFAHDVEQQPMLALYRKIFAYMSYHVSGIGLLTPTPYVDGIDNPWTSLPPTVLTFQDPGIDYEYGLNVTGNRCSFRLEASPISPSSSQAAFLLTHMIVSARKDLVFPVRGAL